MRAYYFCKQAREDNAMYGKGVLCHMSLKEQCHKDFAVLGQFSALNHYFEALSINKMLL